jgi:hypothetical protein
VRIGLVNDFAHEVGRLQSGGKISGKPLADLLNGYHDGNDDERDSNKATIKPGSPKDILNSRSVTDEKDESNFKDKGHCKIFVPQTAHKEAL